MTEPRELGVWFPAVQAGTGTDVFTERLVAQLQNRGIRAGVTWLPLRAEYAPWTVSIPEPPEWATVAHVNTWLHPRFLPKRLPVVATIHHSVHDPALRHYKGLARAAYHRWWIAPNERRVLRRADRVIAVSRFVAETARATLIDVPMEVIYNGVDTDRYRPGDRQRSPGEPFRLLYVGGWKKLKGVDLLAPIMRGLGADFELHYTGGPAADGDRAAMPANMHDLGRLSGDEVVAVMQEADALLFPSRSEGFGLVCAESLACGLPVITTRASSLVEIVDDGRTGILCTQGNVAEFTQAMRRLDADLDQIMTMRTAARQVAERRFGIDMMIDKYLDVYRHISKEYV